MKKPLYWVSGNQYDCDRIVAEILSKYPKSSVVLLDGVIDPVQTVLSNLMKTSLFSKEDKVIRLRGLPANYEILLVYIDYVSTKRVLIIESDLQVKVGRKIVNFALTKFYKQIKQLGETYHFPVQVEVPRATTWLKKACQDRYKKTIEDGAAHLLSERKNGNLDYIISELNTISAYIGKRKKITLRDIEDCVIELPSFDLWRFIDDLMFMRLDTALARLDVFLEHSFAEIELLLYHIIRQFELLLFMRNYGKIVNFDKLKADVGSMQKKDGKVKYTDFTLRAFTSSKATQYAIDKVGTARLSPILCLLYF